MMGHGCSFVSCQGEATWAFTALLPEHVDSLMGFAKLGGKATSGEGGRIERRGPRVGSGLCRLELDDGLWLSWPDFVLLLCIFKESLDMKGKRVAFCGLDLKKKSPLGSGLGEAPRPVPPALAERRDFLVLLQPGWVWGPCAGQEESAPLVQPHVLPGGHSEGAVSTWGCRILPQAAQSAVLCQLQIPDGSFWADSVTSSPNGEEKKPLFLKCQPCSRDAPHLSPEFLEKEGWELPAPGQKEHQLKLETRGFPRERFLSCSL